MSKASHDCWQQSVEAIVAETAAAERAVAVVPARPVGVEVIDIAVAVVMAVLRSLLLLSVVNA